MTTEEQRLFVERAIDVAAGRLVHGETPDRRSRAVRVALEHDLFTCISLSAELRIAAALEEIVRCR